MIVYPYTSAFVIDDSIFSAYGGHFSDSTQAQRNAVYWLAERKVSGDLETFLKPTIVTGSYLFRPLDRFLILDHTYIHRVIETSFIDTEETIYWSQAGTDNVYISLRDDMRGLVDIHWLIGRCNCSSHTMYPYKIQEVYEAGLPTGVSCQPDIYLALTTYADILLNEVVGYGNEAPGDIGVQSYTNQQYSEMRVKLTRTNFGSSARAQFIKSLIEPHRKKRHVGLGV